MLLSNASLLACTEWIIVLSEIEQPVTGRYFPHNWRVRNFIHICICIYFCTVRKVVERSWKLSNAFISVNWKSEVEQPDTQATHCLVVQVADCVVQGKVQSAFIWTPRTSNWMQNIVNLLIVLKQFRSVCQPIMSTCCTIWGILLCRPTFVSLRDCLLI